MLSSSMRRAGVVRAILRAAASGTLLHVFAFSTAACRLPEPEAKPPLTLVEKGATQSVFDTQGRLQRVLIDADGDTRADAQFLYGPEGTPRVAEIDVNRDGVVDRWEHFAAGGSLGRTGRLVHSIEELDTDGDGRGDRRLVRDADGVLTAILIDSERNGTWARRVEVERPRHP